MNKRNNSIGKPLWLPNKTSVCERDALNVNNTVKFETKSTLDIFKDCYFTLDDNLLAKLPNFDKNFCHLYHTVCILHSSRHRTLIERLMYV